MLSGRLPVQIDPLRLARQGQSFAGRLSLEGMRRLAPSLVDSEGEVEVELEFGVDAEGIAFLHGRLQTSVHVVCQRCLETMDLPLRSEWYLGLISSEAEVERLPGHYEPLLVEEGPLHLSDIVEDELILLLPAIPRHAEGACQAQEYAAGKEDTGEAARDNPFAVLASLKKQ